jgi:Carboxypeptidase regulatory-like domain
MLVTRFPRAVGVIGFLMLFCSSSQGQTSSASLSGSITDENLAVIRSATVVIRNTSTGISRTTATDSEGRYSFSNLPIGEYEITIEAATFAKYTRSGIHLLVDQHLNLDLTLTPREVMEAVIVNADASSLNITTPEVATRFDQRRLSELPTAADRSVFNVLLSVPGVSQLGSGQIAYANGISFSSNGGRLRSNSFLLDGQDVNDPVLTGIQMPLNNPDAIQEVRIVTNQFLPEYGHNASSVVNFVGKSGTNDLHGSVFWFHNDQHLNACSNLDKAAGFCDQNAADKSKRNASRRLENQLGFTIGGPVVLPKFGEGGPYFYRGQNKTFFFTDYQRWSDRQMESGVTLAGAPTMSGRAVLQNHAGDRPQVQALLRSVPAGTPNGQKRTVSIVNGPAFEVDLGDLTSSSAFKFDNHQGSARIDHNFKDRNFFYGRYRYSYESATGIGQVTPPGLGAVDNRKTNAIALVWTSLLSPRITNEARIAWTRSDLARDAEDPQSKALPSIQIFNLGMRGTGVQHDRTAFGSATNLPQGKINNTYQITNAVSIYKGEHSFKVGVELRRVDVKSFTSPSGRGSLVYTTLSDFVNDSAQSATKALPVRGGDMFAFYRWHEFYTYVQDQWRIRPTLILSYGVRYEYPGNSFQYLRELNKRILAANNNDSAFKFEPQPKSDTNNWMPRIGFSWNPQGGDKGLVGFLTGGNRLVLRAGYSRTYDANFTSINSNVFLAFPFVATQTTSLTNAFTTLINTTVADVSNPLQLNRSVVPEDFRAPAADQISLDVQRELNVNLILKLGYIRTRGTGLFQLVQGNPRVPCPFGTGPGTCNTTGIDRNTGVPLPPGSQVVAPRVDPSHGPIALRTNSASSTYDALQISLEKRLSRGVSFGVHYTWSTFIDTVSEIFIPSIAESSVSQDPFDRRSDRARSAYDRPHRLSGNIVYELPLFRKQQGFTGKLLGGWQINSFFNFQSGAPLTALNGSDPTDASLITSIRPNVFTNLDVSRMSMAQLYAINEKLRTQAMAQAQQIFNSLGPGPCVFGWLPGPPLPFTLFSAPRARITCNGGQRLLAVDFNGVPEGQRVGRAGRNIMRADDMRLVDLGIVKNTQIRENVRAQIWVDSFNAFNSRNFGIPSGVASSPGFLNQWATDGGNRRIRLGVRLVF